MNLENPLIIQSDKTLLLDVHSPLADECRNSLLPFAELVRSPEHLHTYQLTALSLWNAASANFTSKDAIEVLHKYARYDVPQSVEMWIQETAERFGKLRIVPGFLMKSETKEAETVEYLYLVCSSPFVHKELSVNPSLKKNLIPCEFNEEFFQESLKRYECKIELNENEKKYCFALLLTDRGTIKQDLLKISWPVKDDVPLRDGTPLEINLRETTSSGKKLEIRDYQIESAKALVGDKGPGTGFGTIVLPCGAGKTIVGMQIMAMLKTNTLIVTTNISAVHQWIDELLDKTDLDASQIAEYTGESKVIKNVTVATYQILTWRANKTGPYPHFELFRKNNWGLIIYDEVHMLPAPVFRVAAELQTVRRVGLTATLVREDGCEGYVFSLVGPKRYDVPWKELEMEKWIASAHCVEVRVDLESGKEIEYAVASPKVKYRIASENPAKLKIVEQLIALYPDDKILIIGQYISQLENIAQILKVPLITGKTPNAERDKIYSDFRKNEIKILVVSKVANFAIDLPDASMAIQVSGTFGSRQEEAQRLGRILRPKKTDAKFFTLITRNTSEEEFGTNRQKFLAEQGYSYKLVRYTGNESLEELKEL